MIRRPPRSTRTDTLFPYTTLFRSGWVQKKKSGGLLGGIVSVVTAPVKLVAKGVEQVAKGAYQVGKFGVEHAAQLAPIAGNLIVPGVGRSEEHTSELQSLMRISYAVFCLKKKNRSTTHNHNIH